MRGTHSLRRGRGAPGSAVGGANKSSFEDQFKESQEGRKTISDGKWPRDAVITVWNIQAEVVSVQYHNSPPLPLPPDLESGREDTVFTGWIKEQRRQSYRSALAGGDQIMEPQHGASGHQNPLREHKHSLPVNSQYEVHRCKFLPLSIYWSKW